MNTITPVSVKSRVYLNNVENNSSPRAANLSEQGDRFTPSFKNRFPRNIYDKGVPTGLAALWSLIVTAVLNMLQGGDNEDSPISEENQPIGEDSLTYNEKQLTIENHNENALVPENNTIHNVQEQPKEDRYADDADFTEAMKRNPKLAIKLASMGNLSPYMVLKIVEVHEEDKKNDTYNAIFLKFLLDYKDSYKAYSKEDVDYLTEQVKSAPEEVIEYFQYEPQDTIKILKMREKDPQFAKEYNELMCRPDWEKESRTLNMSKIEEIYNMKKNNPKAYELFMASEVIYNAAEMLFLQNIITKDIDKSIRKIKEIATIISKEYDVEVEEQDENKIKNLIHIGLLHAKHPEAVENFINKFKTFDINIIKPIIEEATTKEPDFLDYILYEENISLGDLKDNMDDAKTKATEYAEMVKKYKPIFDKYVDHKWAREDRFYTINRIFNNKNYSDFLKENGETLISKNIFPKSEDELDVIMEIFKKYPIDKITPALVKAHIYDDSKLLEL